MVKPIGQETTDTEKTVYYSSQEEGDMACHIMGTHREAPGSVRKRGSEGEM